MRRTVGLFCLFVVLCYSSRNLLGQVNTASLSGLVTDSSGSAMAGVRVRSLNRSTGYTREVVTDRSGYYTLPNLPIGSYVVAVQGDGFTKTDEDVELNVGSKARRDFTLRIKTLQQAITVNENGSGSLSRDDASLSTVIDQNTIANTPLYLRNWDDLLRTVPGVQISRYTEQAGSSAPGRTGDFNVNGVHSLQNNFILDGVDNNTFSENVQELSTEAAHPSVDVIQQFNIITNPYSSEYGRSPGAVVSINTKGERTQFMERSMSTSATATSMRTITFQIDMGSGGRRTTITSLVRVSGDRSSMTGCFTFSTMRGHGYGKVCLARRRFRFRMNE
jgi:Carboxypeptidase regulatory-like domain/TonB-dependent Receptor Plug Domain